MADTYTDQFYILDPANPPSVGTTLSVFIYDLVDQNEDGDIDRRNDDSVNGSDVTRSWPGDTVTVELADGSTITYTGTTFYLADGSRVFTPTDGQLLTEAEFDDSTFVSGQGPLDVGDLGPVCFTAGAMIETIDGPRPIEDIREGDMVLTADHGFQPVHWIDKSTAVGKDKFAPVRVCKGALENQEDLIVSQEHRMVISGWRAELFYGCDEVFVAAKHLVNGDTIHLAPCEEVTYFHLMFARHEVIYAEGIPTESFFVGGHVGENTRGAQSELCALFPDVMDAAHKRAMVTARRSLKQYEATVLTC